MHAAVDIDELLSTPEREEDDSNVDLSRQCRIELGPTQKSKVTLTWNGGKVSISQVRSLKQKPIILVPGEGKAAIVELYKAEVWFGPFTIPFRLRNATDEKVRQELTAIYHIERKRALDLYDYPRPRKIADGVDPIGRHRFPDVIVTVIEQDGEEWQPIRLHQLYKIGDYDPIYSTDPEAVAQIEMEDELAKERERNDTLHKELEHMKGQMETLLRIAGVGKKAQ